MFMNKSVLYILIFLIYNFSFSQGLNFESNKEWESIPKIQTDFGFVNEIPTRYSLKQFVPPVYNQQGLSCTGFAVNYYALSTIYNINFGITKPREKLMYAFDPYFSYSIINEKNLDNQDNNCSDGLFFSQVIGELQNSGAKKLMMPPYDTNCDEKWTKQKLDSVIPYTKPYSLSFPGVAAFDTDNLDIQQLKHTLFNKKPIVIGVYIKESLYKYSFGDENIPDNLNGVKDNGLWKPLDNEEFSGGHAMCIIGFDDEKFGGAFQIVNSWGRNHGDKGYIWLRYEDISNNIFRAFTLKINENVRSNPSNKEGLEDNNYVRYSFKRDGSNKLNIYEGEYIGNTNTGYAIYYNKDDEIFYAGKFIDGKKNGKFIVASDEIRIAYFKDDIFINPNELGFGDSDTDNNFSDSKDIKSHLAKFGLAADGFRKANSTSKPIRKNGQ